jgi:hypothetical protein
MKLTEIKKIEPIEASKLNNTKGGGRDTRSNGGSGTSTFSDIIKKP